MHIAFKEWASVDAALGSGRQTILLRKGGIHERHGRFEVDHQRFLIYPTYLHQDARMLKPEWRQHLQAPRPSEGVVEIRHLVEVVEVLTAPEESAAAKWDSLHVYSPELIAMRYAYKPERPLYVLVVRALRLPRAVHIVETPAYAGCRSWVELREEIDVSGAAPVLNDAAFAARRAEAVRALTGRDMD